MVSRAVVATPNAAERKNLIPRMHMWNHMINKHGYLLDIILLYFSAFTYMKEMRALPVQLIHPQ